MRKKGKLRQFYKLMRKVRQCGAYVERLSDRELSSQTAKFRERLGQGESLDDILPEAFAVVCEADRRILGLAPYDVQIVGGIALHKGYLAEMNTGEGKTLAATMPLYLNALTGKSTILVTANEYLALRDAEEMGEVYRFLGLTVAAGVAKDGEKGFSNAEKKEIYASDIVYTTHSVLGFDYLLNNLVTNAKDRFLREFHYVIIDEADAALLDSAQMPLVIAASPRVQSNLYATADFFVTTLEEDVDYEKEEGAVWLTEEGIRYAETFFQIDNFYAREHFEINRHVILALRAHKQMECGKDYVVTQEGKVILLDGSTGRMMNGVMLRGGIHQAIEAKEKLEPSQESRSVAAVTYQNLFSMFPKLAGMSGTLTDAKDEFLDVYGVEVLAIPPNRPLIRKDLPDLYFASSQEKLRAAAKLTVEIHETGRPVLAVADTIEDTELLSEALLKRKVPHNVLNANHAAWEAQIIKEAGQKGAVTVATSMAGRGTDIKLGKGVEELGGLAVLGIGRMSNTRLERQARGRAGRQGNPGTSRFLISLEDGVVDSNGPSELEKYIEGRKRIGRHKLKKIINKAQEAGEEGSTAGRKQSTNYDKVMQCQRDLIYATRNSLLDGEELDMDRILEIAKENIRRFLDSETEVEQYSLNRYVLDNISYHLDDDIASAPLQDKDRIGQLLLDKVKQGMEAQEKKLGGRNLMQAFMRVVILSAVDGAWVEEVDYLQQLQSAVSGRATAQRNVLLEYQNEAFESFGKMELAVKKNAIRNILLSSVYLDEEGKLHILFP